MSGELTQKSPAPEETKVPLEDSEVEGISGGTGGTADPRDRPLPDDWDPERDGIP